MSDEPEVSSEVPSELREVRGVVLLTLLAAAMLFLEGFLALFPLEPLSVIALIFALLSFRILVGARSLRAAFGRACFLFAGLWLLIYPAGSFFFHQASRRRGGQEAVVRRLGKVEKLGEDAYVFVMESLTNGWFPALMAVLCVALGIYMLRSSRASGLQAPGGRQA